MMEGGDRSADEWERAGVIRHMCPGNCADITLFAINLVGNKGS